jgi:hypothetical protein
LLALLPSTGIGQDLFSLRRQIVNSTGAVCEQKILVFVLQMEKFKQSTWMG